MRSNPETPVPPSYSSFGLSETEFKEPSSLHDGIFLYVLWPSLLLCLGLLLCAKEPVILKLIVAFPLLVVTAVLSHGITAGLVKILEWSHPKWPQLRNYRRALRACEKALADWTRAQASYWQGLSGRSFEIARGNLYQALGYTVFRTGGSTDKGIDLVLREQSAKIIVQCKAHRKPIGPGPVRELYGTLLDKGAQKAILASTGGFSSGARKFAQGKPIELLDLRGIVSLAKRAKLDKKD